MRPIRFDNGAGFIFIANLEGYDVLFPVAPKYEGKNLYDEFISSGAVQTVAGRNGWDRGFILFTKLSEDVILSTYNTWY